jgi:hypothetical protein
MFRFIVLVIALVWASVVSASAQERAYFVTYDHYLEEPGNLELAFATTTGLPKNGHAAYSAPWLEVEYGVKGWWTTELYLEGVTTRGDGHGFAGWRVENRFRPLKHETRLNPVFYIEYERISEASRIQKEVVGAGGIEYAPIAELRTERFHEIEGRLILSSAIGSWNLAENFVVEKNLSEDEGLEFGYSAGVSRALGTLASAGACRICAENFVVGVEVYGGLGSSEGFARDQQRHFVAPAVSWRLTDHASLKVSTAIGLSQESDRVLFRVGYAYELSTRGRK